MASEEHMRCSAPVSVCCARPFASLTPYPPQCGGGVLGGVTLDKFMAGFDMTPAASCLKLDVPILSPQLILHKANNSLYAVCTQCHSRE